MPDFSMPHQYRIGRGGQKTVDKVVPHIRLNMASEPTHVLYKGQVYYDNGEPVGEVPAWVQHRIDHLVDPEKVGFPKSKAS